jgi:hypothetical protein
MIIELEVWIMWNKIILHMNHTSYFLFLSFLHLCRKYTVFFTWTWLFTFSIWIFSSINVIDSIEEKKRRTKNDFKYKIHSYKVEWSEIRSYIYQAIKQTIVLLSQITVSSYTDRSNYLRIDLYINYNIWLLWWNLYSVINLFFIFGKRFSLSFFLLYRNKELTTK